ncbi:MAG: PorT family protein [Chitinophagaceae bacterium]|nr:PorT family protein [Chitinophagaceae bacterium]
MKKILFSAALLLGGTALFAQKKTQLILKGGVNFANISVEDDGDVNEASMLTSFHAGLGVNVPITPGFYFQPALLVTGKGSKLQSGSTTDNTYYKSTTNPIYLELPLNFIGKIPLAENTGIILGAGPYVAMGIAGKNKVEGKFSGVAFNSENKIDFSNDDPTTVNYEEDAGIGKMKRFDLGANLLAGLDFGRVSLTGQYGLGFTKIASGTDNSDDNKNKHRVWGISLGLKL